MPRSSPYVIAPENRWMELRPPVVSGNQWDEIFDALLTHRITDIRSSGQFDDQALARLAKLDFIKRIDLEGSRAVTDAGLAHLAGMKQLEKLGVTFCNITDDGLAVLRQLPHLREFHMAHHHRTSDAGLAHLAACPELESVEVLGSNSGDGLIRALAGKQKLRVLHTGDHVTNAGLAALHDIPAFKTWQGGQQSYALMEFQAGPTYLLLRGPLTDDGMESLRGLNGVFALNLDDARLPLTAAGLRPLAAMENLGWLGFDAKDDSMEAIASLPNLRMLMCQDTAAGDLGFQALSKSRSLEYIWGRRCYNLGAGGFTALAKLPALKGLSVSCKNVADAALAKLPDFPSLISFMPMDVPDAGFRHVGQCERLEELWCMYCRDTGDEATEHIKGLRRLKTYYAGSTRITDRSLGILAGMNSLEAMTFSACAGVTSEGMKKLSALPNLRELNVHSMPHIDPAVASTFRPGAAVHISN